MNRIASFSVDRDYIVPGMYISRIDGDITTFDLRTRIPNADNYMDNITMHSVEHMFATIVRNSDISDKVIYFGPMGCQTGFYLLTRDCEPDVVHNVVLSVLEEIIAYDGPMFGAGRKECGNYKNLDVACAKEECKKYLEALRERGPDFKYPEA